MIELAGQKVLPRTPREAKAVGEKYYFTGEPCKRGHVSPRQTSNAVCAECRAVTFGKYYKSHEERMKARASDRHDKIGQDAEYRLKKSEYSKQYYRRKRLDEHYEEFLKRVQEETLETFDD